jgi:hypothetical protein
MISTTMDMWSDKQKKPFMAVTTHWLEAKLIDTPLGPQYKLTLRTDLIGFLRVPGHHDGEHLATAFLYIIDRIGIASKVCSTACHLHFAYAFTSWVGLLLTTPPTTTPS